MFVLAVQLHESIGELAKRAGRCQRAIDEGPAAALTRDLSANEALSGRGVLEDRLDGGLGLASTDQIGGCAPAEQEADGLDQDRLPCPGLTGENVEA